jgi:ABC-type dipeptide/oligopeptide/nickel transport system permease component
MPPMLKFILRRLLAVPLTLLVVTVVLYGIVMLAPLEARISLYEPQGGKSRNPEALRQQIIEEYGLDKPYPVQYARWALNLLQGDWGWSPLLRTDVLEALVVRTPATVELMLYSVLLLVPLGLASGVVAGWRQGRPADYSFRLLAFVATSIPPFILGLMLLGVFYVGLHWFPPGRIDIANSFVVTSPPFNSVTGLLTIDGLLNGRLDISLSAFRHLVLPAITLSLAHWATLGRVTRAAIIEERTKEYITAARGRGLPRQTIIWRHALRNAMIPGLNSTALSAASLVMGVFVVEIVFGFPGVSELATLSWAYTPDAPAAMGFAVYSVLLVLPLMFVLDVIQGVVDPRIREEIAER